MKPGQYLFADGEITLNAGSESISLEVKNTGDRPVQVGSHFHFYEVNRALQFDRGKALGKRLDIPSGTAVRFEPGQSHTIQLIDYTGQGTIYGFNSLVSGSLNEQSKEQLTHLLKAFLHEK